MSDQNPVSLLAGKYENEPLWDEFQAAIQENRRIANEEDRGVINTVNGRPFDPTQFELREASPEMLAELAKVDYSGRRYGPSGIKCEPFRIGIDTVVEDSDCSAVIRRP